MKTGIRVAAAAVGWLLVSGCGGDAEGEKTKPFVDEATLAVMHTFVKNLAVVIPASVEEPAFREGPAIRGALAALADNASVLAEHAQRYEQESGHLKRSLERDTAEILRQYDHGHYDRAAFLVRNVTENCVVCHARLPSPADSQLAEQIVDRSVLQRLPPPERAKLQIATRRFDAALTTLEGILAAEGIHPAMMIGPLTDYLTISVRVKDDYQRPIPVLEKFARRPDLWRRLRLDVEEWIAALPGLREQTRSQPDLATARALVSEGVAQCDLRDPRAGAAHLIVASAVLQRLVEIRPQPTSDLAEAYYLLGQTESRIGRNYWVTEAPFFFETCIRLDPGGAFAEEAYGLLEEEILMSYEGSDWEEIPGEDAALLAELRGLIDAS